MKVEKIAWDTQLKDLLPTGMVWDYDTGSNMESFINALQGRLQDVEYGMVDLFNATMPDTVSDEFVRRWEIQLGIPDDCSRNNTYSLAQRKDNILQKLRMNGGQSIKYYVELMESMGYHYNTVEEFSASRIGDPCDSFLRGASWDYTWRVNIAQDAVRDEVFTCQSECDDFLGRRLNDVFLECLLQSVKPAHTLLLINYFEVFRDNYTLEEAYLNMYKKINGSRVFITDLGEEYIKEDLLLVSEDGTKRLFSSDTTYPLMREIKDVSLENYETQPDYSSKKQHYIKDENGVYQKVNAEVVSIDGLPISKAMVGVVEVDPDGAINIQNDIGISCKIIDVVEGEKQFVMGKGCPPDVEFVRKKRQLGNVAHEVVNYHEFPINNNATSTLNGIKMAINLDNYSTSVRYVIYDNGVEIGSSVPEIDYTNKEARTILDDGNYQYIEFDTPVDMPLGGNYTMRVYLDDTNFLPYGTMIDDIFIPYFESFSEFEEIPSRKYGCHMYLDEDNKLVFTVDDSGLVERKIYKTVEQVRDGDHIRCNFDSGSISMYINYINQALEIIEDGRVLSIANSGESFIIGDDRYGMISDARVHDGNAIEIAFRAPFEDDMLDHSIWKNNVNSNYAFLQGYEIQNTDGDELLFGTGYAPHSFESNYNNVITYDEAKMLFIPSGASYITDIDELVFEGGSANKFSSEFRNIEGVEAVFQLYIPPREFWSDDTAKLTMFLNSDEQDIYASDDWQTVNVNSDLSSVAIGELVEFGIYSDKFIGISGIKGVKVAFTYSGNTRERPSYKFFTRRFPKGTIVADDERTRLKDSFSKFNNLQGCFVATVNFYQDGESYLLGDDPSYGDFSISYSSVSTKLTVKVANQYNDFIIPLVGEHIIGLSWSGGSMSLFIDGVKINTFTINWTSVQSSEFFLGCNDYGLCVNKIRDVVISKTYKADAILIKATTPL